MGRNKKTARKAVGVLCAAAMVAGTFAGCGSNATTASTTSTDSKKKVEFSIIVPYSGDTPVDTSPVFQELEKQANAKLNIQWTPMLTYGDKFNVIMNSNQLPDVLLVSDLKSGTYVDAVKGNQFWQLDSYFSQYKNLKNINSTAVKNAKTEGKLYALPRERTLKRKDVIYRADWAKKAGLGAPDTLQKLYDMAKNFAENDYDGNGQKDTIGLLLGTVEDGGGTNIDCLNELIVANGGYNGWGMKDGKFINVVDTPEYISTIDLLRKMYSEGLISKDFANTKTTAQGKDYMDKEKSGLQLGYGMMGITDTVYKAKAQNDSSLKLSDVWGYTYMKDAKGNWRTPAETGVAGGFAFPKSSVKNEARLKDLLRVMDFLNGQAGQRLLNNGVEGRNYKMGSDGTATAIQDDSHKHDLDGLNQMGMAGNLILTLKPANSNDDLTEKLAKDRNTYKANELINDTSAPLVSATYSKSSSNLNKIIDTAEFKYIIGQIDKNGFQDAIKQWKSQGGDQMAKEYAADYKKSNSSSSK